MERYKNYKDSGVGWIGEIPEHWVVVSVGRISFLGRGRVISGIEMNENPGQFPVYSSQTANNGIMGYLNTYDFEGEYVTWTTDGANAGTVYHRTGKFNCTNVCGTIQPKNWDKIDLRYLPYFLNLGTKFAVRLDINPKLMNGMMAKIMIAIPTKEEQTAIANYLDRKTAEIDNLIAQKKELLKLYEEEKTAIINQAVTKGINPDVKMKDSGVEWLGEIPEHWEVKKLKYVAKANPSNIDKKSKDNEKEIFLCNYIDVYNNDFISNELNFMKASANENQIEKFILKKGDVIATKDSETPDDIAIPALVVENFENVVCGYHLTLIKPKNIRGDYLFRLFQSKFLQAYFEISANGITRYGLGIDKFSSALILLPPSAEQTAIVTHIEKETTRINAKIEKTKKLIELLKEYRTALISEVVTGKIKVIA